MTPQPCPTRRPGRLRAVLVAVVLILAAAGCTPGGGGGDEPAGAAEAKTAAVDWMVAYDNGDMARYCDLSVNGQGNQQQSCLQFPNSAGKYYTKTPEAVRAEAWTDPKGNQGIGVLVKFFLRTAPNPDEAQYAAIGVRQINDRWLVDLRAPIKGDPNVAGAVAESLNAAKAVR